MDNQIESWTDGYMYERINVGGEWKDTQMDGKMGVRMSRQYQDKLKGGGWMER